MKNQRVRQKISGAIWNVLGSTMWALNSFAMLAAVSRFTDIRETGNFGIVFTTAQSIYIIGLFGMSVYQMTDFSGQYPFAIYRQFRMCSCLLMVPVGAVFSFLLNFRGTKLLYMAELTLLMMLNVWADLYESLFFQNNRLDLSGSSLFFRTFFSLLAFLISLFLTGCLGFSILCQLIINAITTGFYIHKAGNFAEKENAKGDAGIESLFKDCFPLFISLLLMNLLLSASKYGVELKMDALAQGYYSMLFMPTQAINLLCNFIFKPLLSELSENLTAGDYQKFNSYFWKQQIVGAGLTVACLLGAWTIGIQALSFFYGQNLTGYTHILLLLVLGGGIMSETQLFYYVFVMLRKQKQIVILYSIVFPVSAIGAIVLTDRFGLRGAAVSFIVSYALLWGLYILMLNKDMKQKPQPAE